MNEKTHVYIITMPDGRCFGRQTSKEYSHVIVGLFRDPAEWAIISWHLGEGVAQHRMEEYSHIVDDRYSPTEMRVLPVKEWEEMQL